MRLFAHVVVALAGASLAGACGGDDSTGGSTSDITGRDSGPEPAPSAPGDAGSGGGGPSLQCAVGATIESEDNGTPAGANAFTTLSFCGVLASGDDVDYATFTTPAGKKLASFQAIVHGAVDFELAVGGATFAPGDPSKYVAGTYLVKASTKAGKPATYELRVDFE